MVRTSLANPIEDTPMRHQLRAALAAATVLAALAVPAAAQQPSGTQPPPGLLADLLKDIAEVEGKVMGLARAMPATTYDWRPGQGARTTAEVLQHIAADNYLLATAVGTAPPASTGIKADDYKTTQAYESRKAARDEVIADLEKSFAHFKQAISKTPAAMSDSLAMFGQKFTRRQFLILATTHLHEHLGQMIVHARSNGVVPPWSR